jgi:hypothetical protein
MTGRGIAGSGVVAVPAQGLLPMMVVRPGGYRGEGWSAYGDMRLTHCCPHPPVQWQPGSSPHAWLS